MIKFYLVSIIVHLIIIGVGLKTLKPKELKFVEKKSMIVSIKNQKAISSFQEVNSNKSLSKEVLEEVTKEVITKQEKKVHKVEKKEPIKKVINKKTEVKEVKKVKEKEKPSYNEFEDKNKFLQGKDGVFTAVSSEGIEFEILKEIDPVYPIRAKKMGYKGIGSVNVKFLVNLDGKISEVIFLNGEMGYGFKEEVEKALKKWEFKPISYKDKIIKVYFEKEFKFRVR